jgi:hypothetical protein
LRRTRCRFLSCLAAALALSIAPLHAEQRSDEQILDIFAKIAFGNEFESVREPRLAKWLQPIRYAIVEREPLAEQERAFLFRHLERLKRLTGLGFAAAEAPANANFLILLVLRTNYAETVESNLSARAQHLVPRLARTNCVGLLRHRRGTHEIVHAIAIIPVDSARASGLITSCIAEETTQVLGLLNDSDDAIGSLFNDSGDARDLTPLDEMLLRLLYDRRLEPGMRPAEALAAAREVLRRVRRADQRE